MTDLDTKKYGFMPRVIILCHSKEKLDFYIYIYIYIYIFMIYYCFLSVLDISGGF
jgi:hypothetical protein